MKPVKIINEIDPWDENLTEEEKKMVLEECKDNYRYFLENLARASEYETRLLLKYENSRVMPCES